MVDSLSTVWQTDNLGELNPLVRVGRNFIVNTRYANANIGDTKNGVFYIYITSFLDKYFAIQPDFLEFFSK